MNRYAVAVPALSLTWVLFTADLSPGGFLVGGLLGVGVLLVVGAHFPWAPAALHVLRVLPVGIAYLGRFLKALVMANLQVAWIVIRPRLAIRPGIIAFRTRHRSELGVTMLANSITLTPGTLTMDVSPEGDTLYIHVLDISHPDETRASIRHDLEDHSLEVIP
ncbi:MAG: Na+/H+ antiporter subunit E [candidate division NC10 bacterium]|nr:Na+/H+ antiporter subunit E [candidate division NC10 bacterium]